MAALLLQIKHSPHRVCLRTPQHKYSTWDKCSTGHFLLKMMSVCRNSFWDPLLFQLIACMYLEMDKINILLQEPLLIAKNQVG